MSLKVQKGFTCIILYNLLITVCKQIVFFIWSPIRSYGSADAFDFEPIFPTRAHRAEAHRRSFGTASSFEADSGLVLSSTPGGPRLQANRRSFANLQGQQINRLSEEVDDEALDLTDSEEDT